MVSQAFPTFDRRWLNADENFTVIGEGELGGKATGLACVRRILAQHSGEVRLEGVEVHIPPLTVIATDPFERFMDSNRLWDVALSGQPDERIALAFQQAELPPLIVGDLRALVARMHTPLALRSSSLLEDALGHPMAGTYATKMVPNNEPEVDARFATLVAGIKFVYASTFFRDARAYRAAIGADDRQERMAVIVQELVGRLGHRRFYPTISGVLRTFNFYPMLGARPEDGVALLALGLGKTIVDGGICWSYVPAEPRRGPPVSSPRELLASTQTRFWAVRMAPPPAHDPVNETEYLEQASLADAELDGALRYCASTYDAESDRLIIGTAGRGPRVLNFAPILELEEIPLNAALRRLAEACRAACGGDVEIEFAATIEPHGCGPARVGFLQLRPMLAACERVAVNDAELEGAHVLVATRRALGNGRIDGLHDVIYVKPEAFEARCTREIARQIEALNGGLARERRPCILIGFGRWGTSDPWLGIPVTWPQICAARVIVEATLPEMNVEPSQGSHFFHNLTSFRVQYFSVSHGAPGGIRWEKLAQLPVVAETQHVRHARSAVELRSRVDGRTGRGVVAMAETRG